MHTSRSSNSTCMQVCTYIACNGLGLFMDLFKIFILSIHKKEFLNLIVLMQKNFWHFNYDEYENSVIAQAKRMCIYFVCVFSFFSQSTVFCYMLRPVICKLINSCLDSGEIILMMSFSNYVCFQLFESIISILLNKSCRDYCTAYIYLEKNT